LKGASPETMNRGWPVVGKKVAAVAGAAPAGAVSRTCTAPLWFFLLCGNIETNFDVFMLSGGGTDWNRRAQGGHWGLRAEERGVHLFFMRFSPSVNSEGIRTDVMLYPCFEV